MRLGQALQGLRQQCRSFCSGAQAHLAKSHLQVAVAFQVNDVRLAGSVISVSVHRDRPDRCAVFYSCNRLCWTLLWLQPTQEQVGLLNGWHLGDLIGLLDGIRISSAAAD